MSTLVHSVTTQLPQSITVCFFLCAIFVQSFWRWMWMWSLAGHCTMLTRSFACLFQNTRVFGYPLQLSNTEASFLGTEGKGWYPIEIKIGNLQYFDVSSCSIVLIIELVNVLRHHFFMTTFFNDTNYMCYFAIKVWTREELVLDYRLTGSLGRWRRPIWIKSWIIRMNLE